MSEPELSTLLREHLADEPPVRASADDAIRRGRRGTGVRAALAGAAVVAAGAAGLAVVLSGSDGGDGTAVATEQGAALPELLEEAAAAEVAPYAGPLGAPDWSLTDVRGRSVGAGDDALQYVQVAWPTAGAGTVQLHVGGFAPPEWETYGFDSTCAGSLAADTALSCEQETLPDGTMVLTSVAPYTDVRTTTKRLVTVTEARADPTGVLWARSVSTSTRDGVSVGATELVPAADPGTAPWTVPVEVLRDLATDPLLQQPDGVAHAPIG